MHIHFAGVIVFVHNCVLVLISEERLEYSLK